MAAQRDYLVESPWWRADRGMAHGPAMATVRYLRDRQREERQRDWLHWALYSRQDAVDMGARNLGRASDTKPTLALNVVRACVGTVHSRIVQNRPKPTFLTSGADWGKQQQVKAVDKFCQGAMYHAKIGEAAPEIALHAAIVGTGVGKTLQGHDGKPYLEPTLRQELVVDRADGRRRKPRVLYQYRPVARDALLRDPDLERYAPQIRAAGLDTDLDVYRDDLADQVSVCEAWRLPSRPGAKDGRHVMCLDTCTLLDEPWEAERHPFVFLRWGLRAEGMWGFGISEQLRSLQWEINRLLGVIQTQMMLAGPKVFVSRGSNINREDITNRIWDVIEYAGAQPPTFANYATVSPELFAQLDRLYSRAFDEVGVSMQAVRGEKAAGVTSGVAMRTANDLQTGRLVGFGQDYEALHVDIADRFVDMARTWCEADAAGEGESKAAERRNVSVSYPVRHRGRQYLERVSLSDIKIARDEYVCQVFPTSRLASTPEARMQQVSELQQGGTISPIEARYLLDFPDLDSSSNIALAGYEAIMQAIDHMLEKGEVVRPEPWTDLGMAIPLVAHALQRAQIDGAPESRWQLLGNYLTACQQEQKKQAEAAQAQAGPPAGAPPAPPGGSMPPGAGQ